MLSDVDIKEAMLSGWIRIEPLDPKQIGPASVDLTLSDMWYVFKDKFCSKATIDLSKTLFSKALMGIRAKCVYLEPHAMCLGKTLEKITLAPFLIGKLEGRSRYARMGLAIHITSALIQPGSSNHQVLEIVNLSPNVLILRPGMRISQVVFDFLESPTSKPYAKYGCIAKKQ